MSNELKTYTLQELYAHPMESHLLAGGRTAGTRLVLPGRLAQSGKKLAGAAALPGGLPGRTLSRVPYPEK